MTIEEKRAEADAAVARGIAWLDKNIKDWRPQIDVDSLDLQYPCGCVLGQIEGDFFRAVWEYDLSRQEAHKLGLAAPIGLPYRTLTAAWKRALRGLDERAA